MGVDGCVAGSTRQVLVLAVRDVQMGLGVTELLGKTKVNNVDLVAATANAHNEVVGLDIAMDEVARVNVLDARDLWGSGTSQYRERGKRVETHKLIGEQKDSLERELAVAEVEEVLEGGAEEIHNHRVVVALGAEPPDEWHADTTRKCLVHFGLIFKLRVLGFDRLELDGDLFAGDDVDTEVDVTYEESRMSYPSKRQTQASPRLLKTAGWASSR